MKGYLLVFMALFTALGSGFAIGYSSHVATQQVRVMEQLTTQLRENQAMLNDQAKALDRIETALNAPAPWDTIPGRPPGN